MARGCSPAKTVGMKAARKRTTRIESLLSRFIRTSSRAALSSTDIRRYSSIRQRDRFEQAAAVVPRDPLERRELDVLEPVGGHRQIALENLALRPQLAVYLRTI